MPWLGNGQCNDWRWKREIKCCHVQEAHNVLSTTKSLERDQWSQAFSNGTFPAVIQSLPTKVLITSSGWRLAVKATTFGSVWSCHSENQAGLQASYMVALRIALQKKPHNIGEKLILPCCKDIVRCMIGDGAEKKPAPVPLSNNTIQKKNIWNGRGHQTAGCCWDTSCTTQNVCNPAWWVNRCSKVCLISCVCSVHQGWRLYRRVIVLSCIGSYDQRRRCFPGSLQVLWRRGVVLGQCVWKHNRWSSCNVGQSFWISSKGEGHKSRHKTSSLQDSSVCHGF